MNARLEALMSGTESVLVIGSGAAGRSAAKSLAASGHQVTVVEKDRVGGTCLWRGCIPKKALYVAARAVRDARRAGQFGVECGSIHVDWSEVLAWKWHVQESFAGDQDALLVDRGIRLIHGDARFISAGQVAVCEEVFAPDHVVIATGSVPVIPAILGAELADTSEGALRYASPPQSLVIVGGGFIALELAGIFASFGTRINIIERGPRVLTMLDPALASVAASRLAEMGVRFHTEASLERISTNGDGLVALVAGKDHGAQEVACERLIFAAGRRPAVDELDLIAGGVDLDDHGRLVLDASFRTSNPRVWACGDAAGGMMQTPIASLQGQTVALSIATGTPHVADVRAVPIACFTTPQLATVGLTAEAARQSGISVKVHRIDSDSIGAAIADDERDSFVQLIIGDDDGVVLGAQIAGPTASDTIFAAAVAIRARLTAVELQGVLGVHPSYAEAENYAAW
jgi:pyruvate/2-oxoglutarate dehydrogenase complex dihydrolipoamide dehydrogenase (E3) component